MSLSVTTDYLPAPTASRAEVSEAAAGRVFPARIPSLDGLRAISIALVLFSHLGLKVYFDSSTRLGMCLTSLGLFGVKIFFVISGYLITLLLLQERNKTGHVDLFHFYVRRTFRILPAAYAYMLIAFLVFRHSLTPTNKILALCFVENYSPHAQWMLGHLWSLGVEEQFYLLWPAAFLFLPRHRNGVLLAVLGLVPFVNVAIIYFKWPYWSMAFYSVADSLASGCLIALIRESRMIDAVVNGRAFPLIPLSLLLAVPIAILPGGVALGLAKSLLVRPWMNVGIALSLEKAVRCAPRALNSRWVTQIGVMSYSIYLWQQPVVRLQFFPTLPILNLVVDLALIGLLAVCSFYLIERPFLQLRRRLFSH